MQEIIEIENYRLGEAKRTSHKRALYFRNLGRALIIGPDGVIVDKGSVVPRGAKLRFLTAAEIARHRNEERERTLLEGYRGDVVFWNGDGDPLAHHRPGEMIS